MFKNLFKLIKRIYISRNYTLDKSKGFYPNSSFLRKNIILFYELGCFLQKKKLKLIADIFFSIPYYFYSIFGLRNISFAQICYLFNSDKSLALDKNGQHTNLSFTLANHYDRFFHEKRNDRLKILEIGIGGHDNPHLGGSSLRAFSKYFQRSKIFGLDLIDKSPHKRKKIQTLMGSQNDEMFLKKIASDHGPFDIIIDDGSHFVEHQNFSFKFLFQHLNPNGIYIIEDMLSAYMKYMGGSINLDDEKNLVTKFSKLTHNVYSEYIFKDQSHKLDLGLSISSIQFFSKNGKGCIVIEKSSNKKDGSKTNPEFKLNREEIKEKNPDHRHNKKMDSGLNLK